MKYFQMQKIYQIRAEIENIRQFGGNLAEIVKNVIIWSDVGFQFM